MPPKYGMAPTKHFPQDKKFGNGGEEEVEETAIRCRQPNRPKN